MYSIIIESLFSQLQNIQISNLNHLFYQNAMKMHLSITVLIYLNYFIYIVPNLLLFVNTKLIIVSI